MIEIKTNVLLKKLSTFSIGGLCKYYLCVRSLQDLSKAFEFVSENKLAYFVLGNGSNLLFADKGFNGAIIHNKIEDLERENQKIRVGAGLKLSKLISFTAENNLSGLENLAGIPASIGGALFMNASAWGRTISSNLIKLTFMTEDGKSRIYHASELEFSYRSSSLKKLRGAIVDATFMFERSESPQAKIDEYLAKKKSSQPVNAFCIGCIFKNPKDNFAGKLIEECGLKGKVVGGARISDLHANFIINEKKASAKDVFDLIFLIKKEVKQNFGVDLEEEIQYLPYEGISRI